MKDRVYTLWKLNAHLKGKEHSRKEQLRRAFKNDQKHSAARKARCSLCPGLSYGKAGKFLKHIASVHPNELWPRDGGDSESDEEVVEHVQDDADSGEEFLYSSTAAGPSSGADPAMIASSSTLPGSTVAGPSTGPGPLVSPHSSLPPSLIEIAVPKF